jgi:L-rhamnose isomerase
VFQDDDYMLGSVTNPDPRIRRKATDHLLGRVDIMDATGSRDLKLWFSDGTNNPGQDAPGTNIEFIVAVLLRAGKLGGFNLNSRFYADDDLMVGAADPFQLFRLMWEVRRGGGLDPHAGIARSASGLDPDPLAAYQRSGYYESICAERVGGAQAGWGA